MKLKRLLALSACALTAAFAAPSAARAATPPKLLRIAVIISTGPESAWDGTFLDALKRVAAEHPDGLTITTKISDPLWGDDAGAAMRLYAQSGQFDMIWAHSTYSDQIAAINKQYPNIMFVMTGSGNTGLGGNVYWVYKRVNEPAYLLGVLAGHATKTGIVGEVGTLPADDVNDEMDGFVAGVKAANPKVHCKVAFIQSWYDPAKAAQYMNSQIAAGADVEFSLVDTFTPCDAHKVVCIGNFRDDYQRSPQLLSAPLAIWDGDIKRMIDIWDNHEITGAPYNGNTTPQWATMAQGGSSVAPFHGREGLVPASAIAAFDQARAEYLAGKLPIKLDVSLPASQ
jgi:basic membrane lipoprotein Med (substrate-binding protein (PBP1-ABC) superfamily)